MENVENGWTLMYEYCLKNDDLFLPEATAEKYQISIVVTKKDNGIKEYSPHEDIRVVIKKIFLPKEKCFRVISAFGGSIKSTIADAVKKAIVMGMNKEHLLQTVAFIEDQVELDNIKKRTEEKIKLKEWVSRAYGGGA